MKKILNLLIALLPVQLFAQANLKYVNSVDSFNVIVDGKNSLHVDSQEVKIPTELIVRDTNLIDLIEAHSIVDTINKINSKDSLTIYINGNKVFELTEDSLNVPNVTVLARDFISSKETVSRTIYVSEADGIDDPGGGDVLNPFQTIDYALNSLRTVFENCDITIQLDTGTYSINENHVFLPFTSNLSIIGVYDTIVSGFSSTSDPQDVQRFIFDPVGNWPTDSMLTYFAQKNATSLYPIQKSDTIAVTVDKSANVFGAIVRNRTRVNVNSLNGYNVTFDGPNCLLLFQNLDIHLTGQAVFTNTTRQEIAFCNVFTDASESIGIQLDGAMLQRQSSFICMNPTGICFDLVDNEPANNVFARGFIRGTGNKQGQGVQCRTEKWVPATGLSIRNFERGIAMTSAGGYLELTSSGINCRFTELNRILDIFQGGANFRRIQGAEIIIDDCDYIVYNRTIGNESNVMIHIPLGTVTGTPNIAPTNFTNSIVIDNDSYINVAGLDKIVSSDTISVNNELYVRDTTIAELIDARMISSFDTVQNKSGDNIVANDNMQFDKGTSVTWDSIGFSSTLNIDLTSGSDYKYVPVSGAITINITDLSSGESVLCLEQDGTGHSVNIGTGWGTQLGSGTINEGPNTISLIQFEKIVLPSSTEKIRYFILTD